jgi:hypothetical protein
MNSFLKAVHYLALCLALGGPLFWTYIWRVLATPDIRPVTLQVWQRVRFGIWFGAVSFLVSGAADLVRVAHHVIDPTDIVQDRQDGIVHDVLHSYRSGKMIDLIRPSNERLQGFPLRNRCLDEFKSRMQTKRIDVLDPSRA